MTASLFKYEAWRSLAKAVLGLGGGKQRPVLAKAPKRRHGFTLLEIIVSLTVASILGTIVVMYMNTSLTRSTEPLTMVQNAFSLNQIAEKITADYQSLLDTDSSTALATLKSNIESNAYGSYDEQTDFITFDQDNNEQNPDTSGENRILKTVISANSQSITVLFTK